ncbi:hypothetical protein [Archangium primigenium]|uniref:hypothetical protein n=1 Tax=[Archangium] primigenium TaxID=2792470 RepID=UPI00195CC08B|nr:hypothetical protein [Archangium primigenium]MBM7118042.1 hypothetical protein [Archangium primigenium]
MKTTGVVVSMLVWLAGCGTSGEPEAGVPSVERSQEVSIADSDGWTYASRYTYYPATHRLHGNWSRHGPGGRRTNDAERQLPPDAAQDLEARLNGIRLDPTKPSGNCGADMPSLTLEYVDASGQSRAFYTDPEYNSCGDARVFVRQEDVRGVLDTCRALLPEPTE